MTKFAKLYLNEDTEDQLSGYGYTLGIGGRLLGILVFLFSIGISVLLFYWKPAWKIKFLYKRCRVNDAKLFLLKDKYDQYFIVEVITKVLDESSVVELEYFYREVTNRRHVRSAVNDDDDDQTALLSDSSAARSSHISVDIPDGAQLIFKYIDHHDIRYYWKPQQDTFTRLHGLDEGVKCVSFHDSFKGLSDIERTTKALVFGKNSIEVEVKSYVRLFFEEVVNPFYVFQLASITLWMSDKYYYYAATIIIISLMSIGISLYETKKQAITLHDMVLTSDTPITVYTDSDKDTVMHTQLVPGDVIEIPANGCTMLCDAVLLTGNCIVNEAMLTGESVPVTKTPLLNTTDDEIFNMEEHKRHILFSGTQVLQTRYYGTADVKAVVIRTGFQTSKGELIRSILYPKPMDFKFYRDTIRFIMVLAGLAFLGMGYSIYTLLHFKHSHWLVIRKVLDIVTIVVPPALPAAMTVGMVYAQGRLKRQQIFCISPPRINLCGKLKLICFDKTGTLTEDGLDLWGMVPMIGDSLLTVYHDATQLPRGPFISAMATCHSLTYIDGKLSGDPLDVKMFEATGWVLEEPGEDTSRFDSLMPSVVRPPEGREPTIELFPGIETREQDSIELDNMSHSVELKSPYEIGIVKQFTFSSSLQRMSVITRTLGKSHMDLFVKGAPEKICTLCLPQSIPDNFNEILKGYTMQGFRVIAFAHKPLVDLAWHQAQRVTRDQVEKELVFCGLLVMQNALKPETTPIIKQLRGANIRTVMVTGDNILTAVSVARECSMIGRRDKIIQVVASPPTDDKPAQIEWICHDPVNTDNETSDLELYQMLVTTSPSVETFHLTVDGRSFAVLMEYFPELMPRICLRGTVFARMGPEQKAQLVKELQSLGYGVGMCGDGANDCSALKAAHAGISLSEAEASVASPFTSRVPNISCVPTVIREGRAALVTSFGCFKYMALYSITQFTSVLVLYTVGTNLGDKQFLYIDLVITTTVAFLMGHTHAYHKLVYQRPKGSLISFRNLFSIFAQILLMTAVQIASFLYLYRQEDRWFKRFKPNNEIDDIDTFSWESTVIFNVSSFLYITLAVVFSIGPPYRKRMWSNKPFFIASIVLGLLSGLLLFYPPKFAEDFLLMHHISNQYYVFKIILLLFVMIHFMISFIIEMFVIDSDTFHKFSRFIRGKKLPNNKYKLVAMEITQDPTWPPVGDITTPRDFVSVDDLQPRRESE